MGYALFIWVVVGLIYDALISMVLSMNNPPGHHALALSFQGIDVVTLIIGAIIILIAKVMEQAQILETEHALTI